MAKKNSASVPVRRDSGASVGRRQAIEAIRAPIAYFSLVLLVIEAILAVTAARATDQQIQIILSYGMIASLIILLVGFLAALFTRPDVLFQTASRNDPIAEFRKLGDELTGNDLAIIARMLGSKPALFDTFYVQTNLESISQINNRLRKLIGLNLVKLCGDSEVELTALGTNYAQCVAKFSSALTCNNTPQDIIATVIDPSIIIIVSHSILEYVPSLAENEFNNVSQFSEHKPPLLEKIGSLQELRQLLLRNTFDVVVFCAYVNSGGAMRHWDQMHLSNS